MFDFNQCNTNNKSEARGNLMISYTDCVLLFIMQASSNINIDWNDHIFGCICEHMQKSFCVSKQANSKHLSGNANSKGWIHLWSHGCSAELGNTSTINTAHSLSLCFLQTPRWVNGVESKNSNLFFQLIEHEFQGQSKQTSK